MQSVKRRVREEGDKEIIQKSRECCLPRSMSRELEDRIAEIIGEKYTDFKPALTSEKLKDEHGIKVGREKL